MKKIVSVVALPLILSFQGIAVAAYSTEIPAVTTISQQGRPKRPRPVIQMMPSGIDAKIIEEINKVRQDPQSYIPVLEAYRNQFKGNDVLVGESISINLGSNEQNNEGRYKSTVEGVKAVDEAIEFLRAQKPVSKLEQSTELWQAAVDTSKNQVGEASSRLEGDGGRKGKATKIVNYGAYNLQAREAAQEVVRDLIVNDGVPGRNYRLALFDSDFRLIGAACRSNEQHGSACVINYADEE